MVWLFLPYRYCFEHSGWLIDCRLRLSCRTRDFQQVGRRSRCVFLRFRSLATCSNPQATTEPLGLLFFTASVFCLLRADRAGQSEPAIIGGVLVGLSNLTHPLTLACAPFYAGHLILSEWLRTRRVKRAIVLAIGLCTGIVLALSPWLVRQRLVQGVWSISTNLGEVLYSATSPKYKTWTPLVRADADRAGVKPTTGARYQYFIAESVKNIQRDPAFYAGQVARLILAVSELFRAPSPLE